MIVDHWVVALAFTLACLASLLDMVFVRHNSVKAFRFFEALILAIASFYYWEAEIADSLPSTDLRVVWIALCTIIIAEIISRQSWGSKPQ